MSLLFDLNHIQRATWLPKLQSHRPAGHQATQNSGASPLVLISPLENATSRCDRGVLAAGACMFKPLGDFSLEGKSVRNSGRMGIIQN